MYLSIAIILLNIIPGTISFSQLSKNTWLMGGSGSFSAMKSNTDVLYYKKQSTIQISGNAGYFFAERLAGGIKLSYAREKVIVDAGTQESENLGVNRSLQFGPFLRYYVLNAGLPYNISVEGSAEYGQNTGKNGTIGSGNIRTSTLKRMTYSLLAGPEFFLNSSIGIHMQLGYSVNSYSPNAGTAGAFLTAIGFQMHLEKRE